MTPDEIKVASSRALEERHRELVLGYDLPDNYREVARIASELECREAAEAHAEKEAAR